MCALTRGLADRWGPASACVADGLTTVGGLLAFADQALSIVQCRAGMCTATHGKAVLPPNPIRLSDIQTARRTIPVRTTVDSGLSACCDRPL